MKLYYSSGACSLAPHIVMAELNMVYEIEAVNTKDKTTASHEDFKSINIKGQIPALKMENGEVLTEGAIISQYLADQTPNNTLLAAFGTLERTRTLEWMNFIATEIHKGFTPLFYAATMSTSVETQNDVKTFTKTNLTNKFAFISEKLGTNDFLMGKNFTIADAYMFTCLSWAKFVNVDYSNYSNITNYMNRVSERPAVMKAMKEEGLIK